MSCHVMSCHIISYHNITYLILSYLICPPVYVKQVWDRWDAALNFLNTSPESHWAETVSSWINSKKRLVVQKWCFKVATPHNWMVYDMKTCWFGWIGMSYKSNLGSLISRSEARNSVTLQLCCKSLPFKGKTNKASKNVMALQFDLSKFRLLAGATTFSSIPEETINDIKMLWL